MLLVGIAAIVGPLLRLTITLMAQLSLHTLSPLLLLTVAILTLKGVLDDGYLRSMLVGMASAYMALHLLLSLSMTSLKVTQLVFSAVGTTNAPLSLLLTAIPLENARMNIPLLGLTASLSVGPMSINAILAILLFMMQHASAAFLHAAILLVKATVLVGTLTAHAFVLATAARMLPYTIPNASDARTFVLMLFLQFANTG